MIIERNPSFTEFISQGCEISLVVAIDFTSSNGDPSQPDSLHYMHPSGKFNEYQETIIQVICALELNFLI